MAVRRDERQVQVMTCDSCGEEHEVWADDRGVYDAFPDNWGWIDGPGLSDVHLCPECLTRVVSAFLEPLDPPVKAAREKMPPLYGVWLNNWGGWGKDAQGRTLYFSSRETAQQSADNSFSTAGAEVREATPEMLYWLDRGIHVQG